MVVKCFQALFLISVLCFGVVSYSLPLSTFNRWILDSSSRVVVKLACTNWASHMEPMLAEGLHKKPLKDIIAKVVQLKFNCVRLTWATYMFTRYYGNIVSQTFDNLNLAQAKQGIAQNNPALLNMTHVQAFEAIVDELGRQGLMVVLDNHVSNPKWCCSDGDGNGFFGDDDFNYSEWEQGLVIVTDQFRSKSQVVGISIRNELRGRRQTEDDWYKYVPRGAQVVHEVNPDVLVIVSGLNYAIDLSFLKKHSLGTNFDDKLVFESHWYSWSVQAGTCFDNTNMVYNHSLFLMDEGDEVDQQFPLFLSEFGYDQRDRASSNSYMNCFLTAANKYGFNWSLWALQGSYYRRDLQLDYEEVFGVLNADWDTIRNPKFIEALQGYIELQY
ncbi:hypothetical protein LWI29_028522 [Acer saccharum]|uniref:Glycoside hydrolase family 5 domain-containing protein n=1 Tax=Acer saccharum TaxID=4024 RepID=A0AA39RWZ5_ACESA|nr:hypothetical protein LWI29_028522 [Acer saccharum]